MSPDSRIPAKSVTSYSGFLYLKWLPFTGNLLCSICQLKFPAQHAKCYKTYSCSEIFIQFLQICLNQPYSLYYSLYRQTMPQNKVITWGLSVRLFFTDSFLPDGHLFSGLCHKKCNRFWHRHNNRIFRFASDRNPWSGNPYRCDRYNRGCGSLLERSGDW